jgi:hypothetical protein
MTSPLTEQIPFTDGVLEVVPAVTEPYAGQVSVAGLAQVARGLRRAEISDEGREAARRALQTSLDTRQ